MAACTCGTILRRKDQSRCYVCRSRKAKHDKRATYVRKRKARELLREGAMLLMDIATEADVSETTIQLIQGYQARIESL